MKEFIKICREINVGEQLRQARNKLGYTQEQVGELVELSNKQITDLENDKSKGSITTIINLCNLYGISMDELYSQYLSESKNNNNHIKGYCDLKQEQKNLIDEIIKIMLKNK